MDKSNHEFHSHEMPDGVTLDSCETEFCECDWVQIQDENGAEVMGRAVGNYVTIKTDILERGRTGDLENVARTVSEYLMKMMNLSDEDSVLVVGIGNRSVIADSLGVCVADKVLATRHVASEVICASGKPIRSVSVISPGVMGVTGINTAEIIKSICGVIEPSLVIMIDALAAQKTSRLCSTIQLTDTGIIPSAGLLGKENCKEINRNYLGIPVIGLGIPTVVSASTIMADAINLLSQRHGENDSEELDDVMIASLKKHANELFSSASPFVATKEIDTVTNYSSYVLSTAINMALFQEEWVKMPQNTY
jgi:spore protease